MSEFGQLRSDEVCLHQIPPSCMRPGLSTPLRVEAALDPRRELRQRGLRGSNTASWPRTAVGRDDRASHGRRPLDIAARTRDAPPPGPPRRHRGSTRPGRRPSRSRAQPTPSGSARGGRTACAGSASGRGAKRIARPARATAQPRRSPTRTRRVLRLSRRGRVRAASRSPWRG